MSARLVVWLIQPARPGTILLLTRYACQATSAPLHSPALPTKPYRMVADSNLTMRQPACHSLTLFLLPVAQVSQGLHCSHHVTALGWKVFMKNVITFVHLVHFTDFMCVAGAGFNNWLIDARQSTAAFMHRCSLQWGQLWGSIGMHDCKRDDDVTKCEQSGLWRYRQLEIRYHWDSQ